MCSERYCHGSNCVATHTNGYGRTKTFLQLKTSIGVESKRCISDTVREQSIQCTTTTRHEHPQTWIPVIDSEKSRLGATESHRRLTMIKPKVMLRVTLGNTVGHDDRGQNLKWERWRRCGLSIYQRLGGGDSIQHCRRSECPVVSCRVIS